MKLQADLVIVGSGFGGSLMAMIARRLGLSVVLLEQGSHPRMTIGESTTPLSNLLLERLSKTYDLPRLAPLTKWGRWQQTYPELSCGLKRGFSFFSEGEEPLLVAASPKDTIADTHWYRAEVDHFLIKEAQALGVAYYDHAHIENCCFTADLAAISGHTADEPFAVETGLLIDATGPRGFLHRTLALQDIGFPQFPATECLYAHFTGVTRTPIKGAPPYPVDDAAVHHIFSGGWVWVLRFNNGVTSAGVVAKQDLAQELQLSQGETGWRRLLERLPDLSSQFSNASLCQPFRYMPQVSYRSSAIAGTRWVMLPSAAGFVDPLLSTGFALTLLGIERLAKALAHGLDATDFQAYVQQTEADLLAAGRLIGALYANPGNFSAFTAVSFLYFAAVSFAETAHRLNKPELAGGFLLNQDPGFGPGADRLLERALHLQGHREIKDFEDEVLRFIEPYNLGAFGKRYRSYPVLAEDLFEAAPKLGATQEQIATMLRDAGFNGRTQSHAILPFPYLRAR